MVEGTVVDGIVTLVVEGIVALAVAVASKGVGLFSRLISLLIKVQYQFYRLISV